MQNKKVEQTQQKSNKKKHKKGDMGERRQDGVSGSKDTDISWKEKEREREKRSTRLCSSQSFAEREQLQSQSSLSHLIMSSLITHLLKTWLAEEEYNITNNATTSFQSEIEILQEIESIFAKRRKQLKRVRKEIKPNLQVAYEVASKLSHNELHFLGEKCLKLITAAEEETKTDSEEEQEEREEQEEADGAERGDERVTTLAIEGSSGSPSRAVQLARYARNLVRKERAKAATKRTRKGRKGSY